MPKLPEENKERDFELIDKANLNRGAFGGPKQVIRQFHSEIPKKLVLGLSAIVFVLVIIYIGASYVYPFLTKQKPEAAVTAKPFVYPVNVAEIKYPGESVKQDFLKNMQNAAKEVDEQKRYKFLEDDFVLLRVFYEQSSSYDYRVNLETYKTYMQSNYPKKVEANNALYDYPCLDKLCKGGEMPSEIKTILETIKNNAVLNSGVKDTIGKNLDSAAINKDKIFQANTYVGVLSMLVSEYKRTNDEQVKGISLELTDFITHNYDQVKIPNELKL